MPHTPSNHAPSSPIPSHALILHTSPPRKPSAPNTHFQTSLSSTPPPQTSHRRHPDSPSHIQYSAMGGGNGAKSAAKRQRNAAKAAKAAKGSQKASNAQAMNIVCKVCRASFMCTMSEASLRQHVDSKHPKLKSSDCFDHLA